MTEYNLVELRKNSRMLVKSFNKCMNKLALERNQLRKQILEHRIQDSLQIGDFVLSNLRSLGEEDVLDSYCQIIKRLSKIYRNYKLA